MNGDRGEELISLLESEIADSGGMANSYISIVKESGEEVCIGSNKTGLLRISLLLSKLAFGEKPGNHIHIDGASEADLAEIGLVISYKVAPWEE